ncbi:glycosyltransferase [Flagellimonas sp. S174]|uniref:glycosyltransferase n=1 Tax=Flagellimonas sp. S174 TaxID=3410790 RepID=UPI003BF484CA
MQPLLFFYDGLICISTTIEGYGKKFNKNTLRIPILTDPDYLVSHSKDTYISKDSFNIGFSGSISISKENLDLFLQVLKKVNERGNNVHFNLCGYGTKKNMDLLDSLIRENNLTDKTAYFGNLNEVEFSSFLGQQDLLIIPRGYTIQNHYGFSTKLSDYLNHKKLILLTDISDNKLYIKDGENGFIVPPDDENAMYIKLVEIIENFEVFENKILPNAIITSKTSFNYNNYKKSLTEFLSQSKASSEMKVLI